MARADLVKKLLESYKRGDNDLFEHTVEEIIEEERKKHHHVVAEQLEEIMSNGHDAPNHKRGMYSLPSIPKDSDREASLLETREPKRYLEDLVLADETVMVLERAMREFRQWDILLSNGLDPFNRLLFCGPSGCGKTVTAEAIAAELGLPLLYVRFDSVVSSLLGETASNLRRVFDYAENGQWVILFDEFDAIGRSRGDETEHGEIKRVVNSFLQILDNFMGRSLVIAATNFEQVLDPAIWRRFDEIIRFGLPDVEQLESLVNKLLGQIEVESSHVDLIIDELQGASFADAERVCLDIRKSCVLAGKKHVSSDDVAQAVSRYKYRKSVLDQVTGSPENAESS